MIPTFRSIISHLWKSTLFGLSCAFFIIALGRSWSFSRHLLATSAPKLIIPFAVLAPLFQKPNRTVSESGETGGQA